MPVGRRKQWGNSSNSSSSLRSSESSFRAETLKETQVQRRLVKKKGCDARLAWDKLCGRTSEVSFLKERLRRVQETGKSQLLVIQGAPGTGKSRLAQSLLKFVPILVTGKFKAQCTESFTAFKQLSYDLSAQLSSQLTALQRVTLAQQVSDTQLDILFRVFPGLRELLQPKSSGRNNTSQFSITENKAEQLYFATREFFHAVSNLLNDVLILVLDDLHHADHQSLAVLRHLLLDPEIRMLIIGTSRSTILIPRVSIKAIQLSNLTPDGVLELVTHAVAADTVEALADLISTKTLGQPRLVVKYLQYWVDHELLVFDVGSQSWHYDLAELEADPVRLHTMEGLDPDCRLLLHAVACLGYASDRGTLEVAYEVVPQFVLPLNEVLCTCLRTGVLEKHGAVYRFPHDTARDEVLSWFPGSQQLQLNIARSLPFSLSMVDLYNQAVHLVHDSNERYQLATLNYRATQLSLETSAYESSIAYAEQGLKLLQKDPRLESKFLRLLCESHFCLGEFDLMEDCLQNVLKSTYATQEDKLAVHQIKMSSQVALGQYKESCQLILDLSQNELGYLKNTKMYPTKARAVIEIAKTALSLRGKTVHELVEGKRMDNSDRLAACDLWAHGNKVFYNASPMLGIVATMQATRWIVHHGLSGSSSALLLVCAAVCFTVTGDFKTVALLDAAACKLLEEDPPSSHKCSAILSLHICVHHWNNPIQPSVKELQTGSRLALATGDVHNAFIMEWARLHMNTVFGFARLDRIIDDIRDFAAECQAVNFLHAVNRLRHVRVLAQGFRVQPGKIMYKYRHELKNLQEDLHETYLFEMILRYCYNEVDKALEFIPLLAEYGQTSGVASYSVPRYKLFRGLIYAALAKKYPRERIKYRAEVVAMVKLLSSWAKAGNVNVSHAVTLLKAEVAAIDDQPEAEMLYRQAITSSARAGFRFDRALAHSRFSIFMLEQGDESCFVQQIDQAIQVYSDWGADGVASALAQQYNKALWKNKLKCSDACLSRLCEKSDNFLCPTIPTIDERVGYEYGL